jgi:hypothetical protein
MPLRGTSRVSTDLSPSDEAHTPEFLAIADALMKPGANLSSAERMELYHRQYWFRLLESIAEDFPILRKMAGEESFWQIIEGYLLAQPSSSFTLRHLGSRLPDYLSVLDGLTAENRRWYAAIAQIEYANMCVFEATAIEPAAPADLAEIEITLQPHVFLLDLPVPADLCADWENFLPCEAASTHLAVWRGADGWHTQARLHPTEYELLLRLRRGGKLSDLFAEPTDPEPSPEQVSGWFANWQLRGWIVPLHHSTEEDASHSTGNSGDLLDFPGVDKMGSQAMRMSE